MRQDPLELAGRFAGYPRLPWMFSKADVDMSVAHQGVSKFLGVLLTAGLLTVAPIKAGADTNEVESEVFERVTAPTAVTSSSLARRQAEIVSSDSVTQSTRPRAYQAWPVPAGDANDFEIHGFVSQGYIRSTANNYLAASKRGSFSFGEVGINFTKSLTDRLSAGVQLFAQSVGEVGEFDVSADWYQLDYRIANWLGVRAGRVKIPFGLYNEVNDIDNARVPILLPQSVYPLSSRNFLLAQSGAEIYGNVGYQSIGELAYQAYGGTIVIPSEPDPTSPFVVTSLSAPYVIGGRLLWDLPIEGLRLGASLQAVKLDASLFFPQVTEQVGVELPAVLWLSSIDYTMDELQLTAEYGRWHTRLQSSNPQLFPPNTGISERMYAMANYRINELLTTGAYYSLLIPDREAWGGSENRQNDFAATMRFDINSYWLVKLEGHYLQGTAALSPELNNGKARSELTDQWGLFLVKTTAYF